MVGSVVRRPISASGEPVAVSPAAARRDRGDTTQVCERRLRAEALRVVTHACQEQSGNLGGDTVERKQVRGGGMHERTQTTVQHRRAARAGMRQGSGPLSLEDNDPGPVLRHQAPQFGVQRVSVEAECPLGAVLNMTGRVALHDGARLRRPLCAGGRRSGLAGLDIGSRYPHQGERAEEEGTRRCGQGPARTRPHVAASTDVLVHRAAPALRRPSTSPRRPADPPPQDVHVRGHPLLGPVRGRRSRSVPRAAGPPQRLIATAGSPGRWRTRCAGNAVRARSGPMTSPDLARIARGVRACTALGAAAAAVGQTRRMLWMGM